MDPIIQPLILYAALAIGAVGVLVALPRRGVNPQLIGVVIAAAALGGAIGAIALNAAAVGETQSPFFYVFALIALLSSLRVITHQKPVYSALYFILTILSSSALYLLVGAEFMAFALIIIYAGAILITYLFVIMLATQAPRDADDIGKLSPYDAYAREPVVATGVGFLLLAVLTGMLATGASPDRVDPLEPVGDAGAGLREDPALLAELPRKAIRAFDGRGLFEVFEEPEARELVDGVGPVELDSATGTVTLVVSEGGAEVLSRRLEAGDTPLERLFAAEGTASKEEAMSAEAGDALTLGLPREAAVTNLDGVGWTLVAGHPVTLEVAGVILLMALLGAVVLARKQIEISEDEKEALARLEAEGYTLPGPVSGEDIEPAGFDRGGSGDGGGQG